MHLSKPLLVALLLAAAPVWAQKAPGNFTYSFAKLTKTGNTIRLDGDAARRAHIQSSQLDLTANAIAFDVAGSSISQVRARDNVALAIDIQPKTGAGDAVHIESKSDAATLTTADRTLVLTGHLSGFYRIGDGPRTQLSGTKATFNYGGGDLNALIESDANSQVELVLPAETGKTDALGAVTLRADSLRIDQKNGAAYFTGNARAFSSGPGNKLDVSAPSFTVLRAANGTIGTLTTTGKTVTKLDLPPDATAPASGVGQPTHVEVIADKATVNRATSTGVFDGNISGFYRLQNSPDPFPFKGDQATVKYDAEAAKTGDGLNVVVTGKPADIAVPAFNLDF